MANSYRKLRTKAGQGRSREVPVHPALAAILAEWKLRWSEIYGRHPSGDDLIVPTRKMTSRAASQSWKDLQDDLDAIELRGRRGHDMRRAFISLALADGARREYLELITHGAPSGRGAFDLYHTPPWPSLCEAVSCLRIERRKGVVLQLQSDG